MRNINIADNDQDTIVEPFNKEYDEQEADDEVEESDVPVESHATQRDAAKKEALLRAQQRLQIINQQQDPHRIPHSYQHLSKSYQPTRFVTS